MLIPRSAALSAAAGIDLQCNAPNIEPNLPNAECGRARSQKTSVLIGVWLSRSAFSCQRPAYRQQQTTFRGCKPAILYSSVGRCALVASSLVLTLWSVCVCVCVCACVHVCVCVFSSLAHPSDLSAMCCSLFRILSGVDSFFKVTATGLCPLFLGIGTHESRTNHAYRQAGR
jgi:hypothetical protein